VTQLGAAAPGVVAVLPAAATCARGVAGVPTLDPDGLNRGRFCYPFALPHTLFQIDDLQDVLHFRSHHRPRQLGEGRDELGAVRRLGVA
jgi:hypothetical protein